MVDVWAPGRRARSAVGADPLGFEHTTTQRQRANAAGTWVRYPGRDHIK
jgi:hypothetical protein